MKVEHASISMAEFEARGVDLFTPFMDRYRIKAMKTIRSVQENATPDGAYKSDGDVAIFSVERNGEHPKYGLVTEVPRVLVRIGPDGEPVEMRDVSFEIRAAYAASRLIEKMAFDEAIRWEVARK